jgi:hypothetical protein
MNPAPWSKDALGLLSWTLHVDVEQRPLSSDLLYLEVLFQDPSTLKHAHRGDMYTSWTG